MPVVTQNTTAMTSVMVLDTLTAWAIRAADEVTITTAFTAAAPSKTKPIVAVSARCQAR